MRGEGTIEPARITDVIKTTWTVLDREASGSQKNLYQLYRLYPDIFAAEPGAGKTSSPSAQLIYHPNQAVRDVLAKLKKKFPDFDDAVLDTQSSEAIFVFKVTEKDRLSFLCARARACP